MFGRSYHYKSFYCYVDKHSGKKIITRNNVQKKEGIEYLYVAACPTEEIAKVVYDRHLAIACM
ncbi:MAG: hypothetical protein HQM14_14210 [SAR324 cluster bacterium]|nr:hypothetical protein [SAR324 cluster bacterium]